MLKELFSKVINFEPIESFTKEFLVEEKSKNNTRVRKVKIEHKYHKYFSYLPYALWGPKLIFTIGPSEKNIKYEDKYTKVGRVKEEDLKLLQNDDVIGFNNIVTELQILLNRKGKDVSLTYQERSSGVYILEI